MEKLQQLRKEITELQDKAKEAMISHHSGTEFENRRSNLQRGKYIAHGHIISLIDESMNGTNPIEA